MMSGTDVVTVFVTAPGRESALALARQVVEESLAACGNVIPNVTSVFRWEKKVKEEEEVLRHAVPLGDDSGAPQLARRDAHRGDLQRWLPAPGQAG